MNDGRVLIVGAGIGGLTAANALRHAGIESVVFEKMEPLRALGSGFVLQPNAIEALDAIGLREPVVAAGKPLEWYEHRTKSGRVLKRLPTGATARELGSLIMGVSRPKLQQTLRDALDGTELRLGSRCTGVRHDDGGVTATFEDGREERGSALIGCDGSFSSIRPIFDDTELRYVGYRSFLSVTDYQGIDFGVHLQTYGTSSLFGIAPMAEDRAYWYGSETGPPGRYDDAPGRKARAMELFGDFHDPIPAVVESTDPENIMPFDIYDLPRRERWAEGRVTLVGDAAHPMAPALGQGACQAIEDGVALARHLQGADDIAAALRGYEAERIARVTPIVKLSKMQGHLIQGDHPWTRAGRMAMLRGTPPGVFMKRTRAIWTGGRT